MTLKDAFDTFASKAPVNYPGPQKRARMALQIVNLYLTLEEQHRVAVALAHALICGEGRAEFDAVCADIRKRFVQEGRFVP